MPVPLAGIPVPLALRFGLCGTAIPGCAATSHVRSTQAGLPVPLARMYLTLAKACATGTQILVFVAQPFLAVLPQATNSAGTKARYLQTDPLESSLLGALRQRIKIAQARMPVPL